MTTTTRQAFAQIAAITVTFNYLKHGSNDPTPFGACVCTENSVHAGNGRTPAEALFNAASHWLAYSNLPADWRDPVWTDDPDSWHRCVARVIRSGWSTLTEQQRQAIASACNRDKRT